MGYIHCCSGLRKAKSFYLMPQNGYNKAVLDYLEECPVCGHSVAQLTRIDFDNNITIYRKINDKARKLFQNVKNSIICEKNEYNASKYQSKFYLYYNEFGKRKKCYSNLSKLKMGLLENFNTKYYPKQID